MIKIIAIIILLIVVTLIYRLISKQRLVKWSIDEVDINEHVLLDVRNYNISYKSPIEGAYNIPSAYLKRYYAELPRKDIILATLPSQDVHFEARYLKRKGFNVIGFVNLVEEERKKSLTECY